jgi:hypothetical protein
MVRKYIARTRVSRRRGNVVSDAAGCEIATIRTPASPPSSKGASVLVFDRHPQWRVRIAISTALLLSACGGGGGSDANTSSSAAAIATPRAVEQTDLQIATAIYAGTSRTPADFYSETVPSGHEVVAKTHVKNTDIDPSVGETQPQFELCTDDWNQALAWSETGAHNDAQYSELVATNDDARYFEFGRMRAGSPQQYVQSRVYKCAYLERSATNLRTGKGAAGTLNIRPLTVDELKRMSEYLWQFTTYNNFGHAVLKSAGLDGPSLEHTLHIASLVRGGFSSGCDRIDVIAWRHSVDATTGALTLSVQQQFSFGARESSGVAQLCSG